MGQGMGWRGSRTIRCEVHPLRRYRPVAEVRDRHTRPFAFPYAQRLEYEHPIPPFWLRGRDLKSCDFDEMVCIQPVSW